MQWWIIVKMIAKIIGNLPFDASEAQVNAAVTEAVEDAQNTVTAQQDMGIPQSDWEELIGLITPIILWILKRFNK